MSVKKIGTGNTKILIVHGWLHSSYAYADFSKKLLSAIDCEVHLFNVPSFGSKNTITCINMLDTFGKIIEKLITTEKYDLIIGHSMGGQLIIRGIEDLKFENIPKVMLVNPVYYGINKFKPFCFTPNISGYLFEKLKKSPNFIKYPISRFFTCTFINNKKLINKTILDTALMADGKGAFFMYKELALDNRRIKNSCNFVNTLIIHSKYDKIISRKKINLLMKDGNIDNLVTIKNIGHTPVIEDADTLLKVTVDFFQDKLNYKEI